MTRINPAIRSFLRAEGGIAVIEFAMALPLLLAMLYGVIELTRYILITQKVEKLAHTVADITAQSQTVTAADLNEILDASAHVMAPYAMGGNSRIIISSLYRPPNPGPSTPSTARVNWCYKGGGSLAAASEIGALGATPAMPGGFTFNERENVIAAEVFYAFSPLITTEWFSDTVIYRAAFYRPRLGALTTAAVSCS